MSMKDLWFAEHERLVAEYMNDHPGVSWEVASERTASLVNDSLVDRLADYADDIRKRRRAEAA